MARAPNLSVIEFKGSKYVIMDSPTDENIQSYIKELKKHDVHTVVRCCEPSYGTDPLYKEGIRVVELPFTDGDPPTPEVVKKWLELLEHESKQTNSIALHCVAGLGRTPVLVVVALIEKGMESLDAVELVRKKRRGAINQKQLKFVEQYRSTHSGCCTLL